MADAGSLIIRVLRRGRGFRALRAVEAPGWPPPPEQRIAMSEFAGRQGPVFPVEFYYELLDERLNVLWASTAPDRTGTLLEVPGRAQHTVRHNVADSQFRLRTPVRSDARFIRFVSEHYSRLFGRGEPVEHVLDIAGLVKSHIKYADAKLFWDPGAPRPKVVTVCLVSEGYQPEEQTKFNLSCQALANHVAGQAWLNAAPQIAFASVFHPSVSTGTDYLGCYGKTTWANTVFDSGYGYQDDCYLLEGLPEPPNGLNLYDIADSVNAELTLVLVNSSEYGGSSDHEIAWFPANSEQFHQLAMHELGHLLGLKDEYEDEIFGKDTAGIVGPNVCSDPTAVPWMAHVATPPGRVFASVDCPTGVPAGVTSFPVAAANAGEVGAFQGAAYDHCAHYRPQIDCKMRTLGTDFCVVCRAAVIADLVRRANA